MTFPLEDLDEALEHESLRAKLVSIQFLGLGDVAELEFDLRRGWVEPGSDGRDIAGRVGLRFHGVADWSLKAGHVASVRVAEDHPALVPLTDSVSRLSYKGEPADSEATLAALHLAHARGFGNSVATFLQPGSLFPEGWATGTVAAGPTSLMQTYAVVLEQHGLQASLLPATNPTPIEQTALTAWAIGPGYVIAQAIETYADLPATSLD